MVFHVGTSKGMFVDVDRYLSIFTEFGIFTHFVIHKAELATCSEQEQSNKVSCIEHKFSILCKNGLATRT